MATKQDILAELQRRGAINQPEGILDAIIETPGRAARMAVGGVAELGGLFADPLADLVNYAVGDQILGNDAKGSALALFDSVTGGEYAPSDKYQQMAQTGGEFLMGGGAMGKAAKLAGAAPQVASGMGIASGTEALGAISGGTALEAAKQADMSLPAQTAVSIAASMIPIGARAVSRGMLPKTAKDIVDAQLQSGGKVTVGGVLGGEVIPRIEAGLAQAPIVGAPMRQARIAVAKSLDDRLDDIAMMTSSKGLESLDDTGSFLRTSIAKSMDNKISKIGTQYDAIFDKIPANVSAETPTAKNALDSARSLYARNPNALKILDDPLLDNLTSGSIPAKELKSMRPQIKELADRAKNKEGMGRLSGDITKIYHALNDDIKTAASQYVKGADVELGKIDAQFKAAMDLDGRLSRWIGSKGDESLATSFKKLGGTGTAKTAAGAQISTLEDIAKALPKSDVKELSGFMLRNMGRNSEGALNPSSFVAEYSSMNPKSRKILFGRGLGVEKAKALDKIVKYAESSKTTLNPSGTAASTLDVSTILAGAYGAINSPSTLALATIPYLTAKGLASQSLAKAINNLPRASLTKPLGEFSRMTLTTLVMKAGANKREAEEFADNVLSDKDSNQGYDKKELIRQELLRRGVTLGTNNSPMGAGGDNNGFANGNNDLMQQSPSLDQDLYQDVDRINASPQSALPQHIKQNEGLRYNAYMDTPNNRSVGYGFNMQSGIAKDVWKRAGIRASFDDVFNGRDGITPQEAEALGQASFQIAAEDAMRIFPDIMDYTPARQEAILDLSYQLGAPRLSEFKSTIAAAKQGKWTTAANHLLKSEYAKQTPKRARQVARAFING